MCTGRAGRVFELSCRLPLPCVFASESEAVWRVGNRGVGETSPTRTNPRRQGTATQRPSGSGCSAGPSTHLRHSLGRRGPLTAPAPDPPRDYPPKRRGSLPSALLCSAPRRTLHRHATAPPLTTPTSAHPQLAHIFKEAHPHHHHHQTQDDTTTPPGSSELRWRPSSCRRW